MATRKKATAERQPESPRRAPQKVARREAPSTRVAHAGAPTSAPVAGLSSAVLQFPLRLTQPCVSPPAAKAGSIIERTRSTAPHTSIPRPLATLASRHPTVRARFGELREALAEGFEIVQPIFARPLWTTPDDSATAFNFVLTRERTTRLVIVPEGRTVERFIRDRQLMVDYRR